MKTTKQEKIQLVMQAIYDTHKIKRDVENDKEHIWIDNLNEVAEAVVNTLSNVDFLDNVKIGE
jgi:uncharacterized protein YegJ (DUF2314 family)